MYLTANNCKIKFNNKPIQNNIKNRILRNKFKNVLNLYTENQKALLRVLKCKKKDIFYAHRKTQCC